MQGPCRGRGPACRGSEPRIYKGRFYTVHGPYAFYPPTQGSNHTLLADPPYLALEIVGAFPPPTIGEGLPTLIIPQQAALPPALLCSSSAARPPIILRPPYKIMGLQNNGPLLNCGRPIPHSLYKVGGIILAIGHSIIFIGIGGAIIF